MESQNYKIIKEFLDKETRNLIIDYVNSINQQIVINNHHLKHLIDKINGSSYMYDISDTDLTNKITSYQSGGQVMKNNLPPSFHYLIEKISNTLSIPKEHIFLQIVDMKSGGKINPHYDAAFPGYVNYKCNISVLSEDYDFAIDNQIVTVQETDLYCFEASLYKHWTVNPFNSRRILLSFGFMLPYEVLNRKIEDPRIRLSNRIEKYFQK